MTEGRKCQSCKRSIDGMHFNARYCHREECRRIKRRESQQTQKREPPKCCADVYSVPSSLSGSRKGHAGTNYNPADQVEARKSALDWLLKGRKPERMNPAKIKVNVRLKSWRESHAEALKVLRRKDQFDTTR